MRIVVVVLAAATTWLPPVTTRAQSPAPPMLTADHANKHAAVIEALRVEDMILSLRAATGALASDAMATRLRQRAEAWMADKPPTPAEQQAALRRAVVLMLDAVTLRVADAQRWPADRPAEQYSLAANLRLGELRLLVENAAAPEARLRLIAERAVEVLAWTRGQARPGGSPFDGAEARIAAAAPPLRNYCRVEEVLGTWKSAFGPVTFTVGPRRADGKSPVGGHWNQDADKRGQIRSGSFDTRSCTLQIAYFQNWNNVNGQASFRLRRDGTAPAWLDGTYQGGGGDGRWELRR